MRLKRARGDVLSTLAAALLVGAFLLLALRHVSGQDATLDERAYLGVGRAILGGGGWDGAALLHPPLAYYVSSLPLLALEGTPSPRDPWPLLLARLASLAAFGVPLLLAVFAWARALYGRAAALVALGLAAFSPTLLAHAPLATPDAALAATGFGAVALFWRRPASSAGWGTALGLALLAKAPAVLVAAALAALALLWRDDPAITRRRVAAGFAVAWLVLLAGYGFSGLFDAQARRAVVERSPPALRPAAAVACTLLPPPYLRMLGRQAAVARRGWPSYLLGEISDRGFPHYYAVALLVKETIPFLVLLAAAAASLAWARPRRRDEAALLVPALLFFLAFSLGTVQIGIRYVLPALPFLFVFAARVARGDGRRRMAAARAGAFALVAAHAASSARGGPDYLSYFNAIAGGPEGGLRVLGDSNLDWGQNQSRAEEYARRHGAAFQPLLLPRGGLLVVSTNRVQGIAGPRYRRLLQEYDPVDRVGNNWLVYDLARNRRFPEAALVPVLSGAGWRAAPPRPGWPDAGADDERWPPAAVVDAPGLAESLPGTDARPMTCAADSAGCAFRHALDLDAPPAQAIAWVAAPGPYALHVNGARVAGGGRCGPPPARARVRLEEHLSAGRNVLALRVDACGGTTPAALFEMRLARAAP